MCVFWWEWVEGWRPSLIAQLVNQTQFDSWVGKIHWRRDRLPTPIFLGFPCGSAGKESACNAGDLGLIPELGRSPGEGKGYPLQYSGLENSRDYTVHGVAFPGIWEERNENWNCPSLGPLLTLESWCLHFISFICIFILNNALVSFSSLSVLGLMHFATSGFPDLASLLQSHCVEGLPGGPVVKTLPSNAEGSEGFNPWSGK